MPETTPTADAPAHQPSSISHQPSPQPSGRKLRQRLAEMFRLNRSGGGDLRVSRRSGGEETASREATINQLRKGYTEVVDTMSAVRQHLDEQSQRSDRMLQLLEGLPALLKSLPEQNERQTRVLEAIHTNLESQHHTTGQLSTALDALAKATQRQEQTAQQIHEHLGGERDSREQLIGSIDSMTSSQRASRDAMNQIAEQTRQAGQRVRELFQRGQKQMIALSAVSWAMAIAAIAVAGYVAVMVGHIGSNLPATPTTTTPTAATAPAVTPQTKAPVTPTVSTATPLPPAKVTPTSNATPATDATIDPISTRAAIETQSLIDRIFASVPHGQTANDG